MNDEQERDLPAGGRGGLEWLNSLSDEEAVANLLACGGSPLWARAVAEGRPYADARQLFESADRVWWKLRRNDWLEAFRSHPRIGERKSERETGEAARAWSEEEQSAARDAEHETLAEIARLNRVYEEGFGYIYLISARGRSAEELLETLRRRLGNDPETEICVAAEEHRSITRRRLHSMLGE